MGCINDPSPYHNYPQHVTRFFDNFSLASKQISGPGLVTATWNYDYGDGAGSYYTASVPWNLDSTTEPYIPPGGCSACNSSKIVIVTGPTSIAWNTFGTSYANNEGQLLETQVVDRSNGQRFRATTNTYVSDGQAPSEPFANIAGQDLLPNFISPMGNRNRPVTQTAIEQDGATFITTTDTFDAYARGTKRTETSSLGFSRTNETAYHDDTGLWVLGQVAKSTIAGIVSSETTYSSKAQPLTEKQFGKLVSTIGWNPDGTLASVKDGNNHITTLSNWKRGIPQTIGYADGSGESAGVSDSGWVTWVKDENNFTTSYGYDGMGRLASITYPSGTDESWNKTQLSFTPIGSGEYNTPVGIWVQKVQTGNGITNTYFDAMWRPLVTEHFDNTNSGTRAATLSQTVQRYDVNGRTIFTSYPINNLSSYSTANIGTHTSYDALDRVTEVVQDWEVDLNGLSTRTEYLPGFQTKVTNPRRFSTTTSFQAFGEPDTANPVSIAMPEGATITITRDPFGKPLSVKRSGSSGGYSASATRWFVYDGNQLLCKRIEPETNATLFSYDGANNVVWSAPGTALTSHTCDRGSVATSQKIVRTYDLRNRVRSISYPDGTSSTAYTYAADGAMTSAVNTTSDGSVATDYEYDMRRKLTSERLSVPGAGTFAIGYDYDLNGHLGSLSYPDVRTITFAPNALGQPTQSGSYATDVSYFPNGGIKRFNYGDGSVHTLTQNLRGLPERSRDSSGAGAVLDNSYDYDENGNVAAITDALPGYVGSVYPMEYDRLDRLTSATSLMFAGTHQASFTYDPLDNLRTAKVGNGNQYTYSYDPDTNLLASMTGSQTFDFGYDARGNLTRSNAQTYTFDVADRLRSANGLESYLYDAAGRRARKSNALTGTLTYYFYGRDGSLLHEWDPSTLNASDYVYLGGSLVAKITKKLSPPPVPGSIAVPSTSSTASVPVSWAPSTGATTYTLQQQFNGGSWVLAYNGNLTSTIITDLADGSYVFRVQACNAYGCSGWRTSGALTVALIPPTPASITVPSTSSTGSVPVSWAPAAYAASYTLQQQFNGGSWTQVYSGSLTSTTRSGLGDGTYKFQVRACNGNGCSGWKVSGILTVVHPPTAPSSITVPASSYSPSIPVSWNTSANADTYVLEQSANAGTWGQVYSGAATSRTVTVSASGSYQYRVKACNAGGCSGYTSSGNVAVTLPPASAPSLSASSTFSSTGSFTMTWTAVTGATRYQLNQSTDGGTTWTAVYNGTSRSWASGGLGNGTYAYKAYGWDAAGFGPASNKATVTVLYPPASVTAPSLATVNKPFSVSWGASTGATRYELQQTDIDHGRVTTAYSGANTSVTLTLSGPVDTDFQYAARACNSAGCSAWTNCPHTTYLQRQGAPLAVPAVGGSVP